jgi:hypothetical protein
VGMGPTSQCPHFVSFVRTTIHLIDHSKLACLTSLGMTCVVIQLRPSNVTTDDPSTLSYILFKGMGAD